MREGKESEDLLPRRQSCRRITSKKEREDNLAKVHLNTRGEKNGVEVVEKGVSESLRHNDEKETSAYTLESEKK
jgi:hypothetical protein